MSNSSIFTFDEITQIKENGASLYLCIWEEPAYPNINELHTFEFFSTDLGYDTEDIQEIANLKLHETYHEKSPFYPSHSVIRII